MVQPLREVILTYEHTPANTREAGPGAVFDTTLKRAYMNARARRGLGLGENKHC